MAVFGEAGDEVERRVDDTPRQVAANRACQQRARVIRPGVLDAYRAGNREYHDEAEDNFGEALERTEDAGAKDPDANDSAATCFCESSVAWASDVKRSMRPLEQETSPYREAQ